MPYCPTCGATVGARHQYCHDCGEQLSPDSQTEAATDDHRQEPGRGFLSEASYRYLSAAMRDDRGLEHDDPGFEPIQTNLAVALEEFAYVDMAGSVDLFRIAVDRVAGHDVTDRPVEALEMPQQRALVTLQGLFAIPALYDATFGVDWHAELDGKVEALIDAISE